MNKLNLGCGPEWKSQYPGYTGLDIMDYGQDYVGNALELLLDFPDDSFDEVMANHFLEHFSQDELKIIFSQVSRILKMNGIFRFVVPHKDKESAWVLSHKTFWCEGTVKFFEREDSYSVYGFGWWIVKELIVNERKDIHVQMTPVR